jgi:hypothetical protein
LAKAEFMLATEDGLFHLQEGLTLLQCVIDGRTTAHHARVAGNLGVTYTTKIYARIKQQIDASRNIPEPDLERMFAVIRAFDETCFELPPAARALKIEVVKRLLDLYCEGYSPAEKERAHKQLVELARDGKRRPRGDRR